MKRKNYWSPDKNIKKNKTYIIVFGKRSSGKAYKDKGSTKV